MIGQPLTWLDIVVRLLASLMAGFVVGLDRESRGRPAGLRTTILVCTASALAVITADILYVQVQAALGNVSWRPDPNRIIQGILTGIGFLGAGTILRQGTMIRGLTTAAGLWAVTIIGVAFGSGYYLVGGIGTVLTVLVLLVLPYVEKLIRVNRYATLSVTLELDGASPDAMRRQIEAGGFTVQHVDLNYNLVQRQRTLQFELSYRSNQPAETTQRLVDELARQAGVQQVSWTYEF